jgi:mannose-6-phosphate isomerase
LGVEPDGKPQAELWLGAHPSAPSGAQVGDRWVTLNELIADDPDELLGHDVVDRFGSRLPFLFKVLAVARPLSIQVHPTLQQAREGFVAEDVAAIPRRSPGRTYRDRNHKPEILCALTPFELLSGFRPAAESAELFAAIAAAGAPKLRGPAAALARGDLADVFWELWAVERREAAVLVEQVAEVGPLLPAGSPFAADADLAARLAALHPADVGVVVALLLNRVTLQPGQAVFAPAGRVHAYVRGAGVELMANSDNVIRAGLTSKRVDLAELGNVLRIAAEPVELVATRRDGQVETFLTPVPDFELARILVKPGASAAATVTGPEILLCLRGRVSVGALDLARGESVFVPASARHYVVSGDGVAFRAAVGPAA